LLIIIKGITGAKTGGKSPTEREITLGTKPTIIAPAVPIVAAEIKSVALTIGPTINCCFTSGATVTIAMKRTNWAICSPTFLFVFSSIFVSGIILLFLNYYFGIGCILAQIWL